MVNDRLEYRRSLGLPNGLSAGDRQTVTIFVPDGYANADEFLKDCQFERAEVFPSRVNGDPCPYCRKPYFDGDTCTFGGCPVGGDF